MFGASGASGVKTTVVPLPASRLTVPGTVVDELDNCTEVAEREPLATGSLKTITILAFKG